MKNRAGKPKNQKRRGRDNQDIASKVASEYLEVERRQYHEQLRAGQVTPIAPIRAARAIVVEPRTGATVLPAPAIGPDQRRVEDVLREAAPRFRDMGWTVKEER